MITGIGRNTDEGPPIKGFQKVTSVCLTNSRKFDYRRISWGGEKIKKNKNRDRRSYQTTFSHTGTARKKKEGWGGGTI